MTNYSKWDKFAADLASDTDSEEERDLSEYTTKRSAYIHIPAKEFSHKVDICRMLEEARDFEAVGAAVGNFDKPDPEVANVCRKYGWADVGSQFVSGYAVDSGTEDCWRLFFDDNFLTTQKQPNPAARALLGCTSLGSFVVTCVDAKTRSNRLISRKEVADLIIRRGQGLDRDKILLEHERQRGILDQLSKSGVETVNLKG